MRGTTLQWLTGLLATLIGAQMLIVPHQLSGPTYDLLRPQIAIWGAATLLPGLLMIVVAATGRARWSIVTAHLSLGIVLVLLAGVYAVTGGWFGAPSLGALGIAALVAPVVARAPRGAERASDLTTVAIGAAHVAIGLLLLLVPDAFAPSGAEWLRASSGLFGVGFTVCGGLVIATQLLALTPGILRWSASLVLVAVALLPILARTLSQQIWTGIALALLMTLVLVAGPWIGSLLERIDPRSLRTRLAVTLAISSALALILVVTVDANREEQSLRGQASASQQTLATALGQDVADYVELHEAATRALAAVPNLVGRPQGEQVALLRAHSSAYPSVVVFGLFDATGRQLARSDGRPLASSTDAAWFQRMQQTLQPVRATARSTSIQRPIFAYADPIFDVRGSLLGVVTVTVESSRIAEQLGRVVADPNQRAYLVDSQGHTIAHPDVALTSGFVDLTTLQPVQALLGGDQRAGSLVYQLSPEGSLTGRAEWLAGYSRVPGLEWGVVVEQPTSVALASVRSGRERAFVALILVVCLAAAIGAVVAGWLAAPLAVLSLAVRRLADGTSDAQLGRSSITEIARLAGAFGEMRERLAARTREHERSEMALRESEERLRLALEAGRMGTWDWSVPSNELTWDGSLEEIHGLARGTFDGQFSTFLSLVHSEDREPVMATIRSALEDGHGLNVEFRVVWPDGSIHWIAGIGRSFLDAQGAPSRMAGIGLEVTERRRATEVQQVLAEAGSRLVSSLDHETTLRSIAQLVATTMADYCIVEVQTDEDDEGGGAVSIEVAHADQEMALRARQVMRELDSLPMALDGAAPDDRSGPLAGIDRTALHAAPVQWSDRSVLIPSVGELPAVNGDRLNGGANGHGTLGGHPEPNAEANEDVPGGRHRLLMQRLGAQSSISVPLLARERTIGALTLISAESGRRYGPNDLALAEALAARAALAVDNARLYGEAQAAIRSRDEFLSIASHELRTPVTGIKGYAQFLLRAQERNRLESARLGRALRAIDEATDRLTTLTQDLLDVSRIRLGQLPLRIQELDLAELVRRVGYRFSDQLPPEVELILDLRSPVPSLQGDADRLEQVISNLLENAIKYSPEGGMVRVEMERASDEIVLQVHDQGIGLPAGSAEAIFRPFGRAQNAAQRNLPGMGLGLYICRNIVERHGGRVTASSPGEGLGTTIRISLPCPAALEAPPASADSPSPAAIA
ncbi:MAG: ATP-binding protein [Chloroflexota bacterium]